jgi:hypothetical protein
MIQDALWVINVHGNDLVIALTLINHVHDTNGPDAQEAHWYYRLLHHNQHVDGILQIPKTLPGTDPCIVTAPCVMMLWHIT